MYLPIDCPICGRRRLEFDEREVKCEKCGSSSDAINEKIAEHLLWGEKIKIDKNVFLDVLRHLNGIMNLFGFGTEYGSIVRTVRLLPIDQVDVSHLYQIKKLLKGEK